MPALEQGMGLLAITALVEVTVLAEVKVTGSTTASPSG
ncbi:hypothetical protein BOO71_0005524 [Deinococcus marmoris]|uniref:Uncharacterized protein n=1 Tax=Deinococcus marmoris TaxID=249408 RepID=A0A1U7NZW5_9DEIO|nr:hypothetical protein BOO71_0005524 [Deinococcus marmoris]